MQENQATILGVIIDDNKQGNSSLKNYEMILKKISLTVDKTLR